MLSASKYVQIIADKTFNELKTTDVEISDDEIKQFITLPFYGFIEKIKSKVDDQQAVLVNRHAMFLGGRRRKHKSKKQKKHQRRNRRTQRY